ncbi:hypothetical protein, partial [Micromonospora inaquosa]|uniref:hypothetical protein n=1 Tax=Micromonospora inaquosa TaxID=2203716 RepID=UPI001ABFBFC5
MSDGGVSADALGEADSLVCGMTFEQFLDSFVDVPEAGFEFEDGFADDGEAEVAGFDHARVDGADGDFVDAGALDDDERERFAFGEGWAGFSVVAHGVPAGGPVGVSYQAEGQWRGLGLALIHISEPTRRAV